MYSNLLLFTILIICPLYCNGVSQFMCLTTSGAMMKTITFLNYENICDVERHCADGLVIQIQIITIILLLGRGLLRHTRVYKK